MKATRQDEERNDRTGCAGGGEHVPAAPDSNVEPAADADVRTAADGDGGLSAAGGARRRFIDRSARLLIYVPPLIQLFIPSKAMAASHSVT